MLAIKIICGALCIIFAIFAIHDADKTRIVVYSANSLLFAFLFITATMTNM